MDKDKQYHLYLTLKRATFRRFFIFFLYISFKVLYTDPGHRLGNNTHVSTAEAEILSMQLPSF